MQYVVNVSVLLRRDDRWLLIVRGPDVAYAGVLAAVGGRVDATEPEDDVLEQAGRREVAEEVGVDLSGTPLTYLGSTFFVSETGHPVIDVRFAADLPATAAPRIAAPAEVAALRWATLAELEADPGCPPWTLDAVRRAAATLP